MAVVPTMADGELVVSEWRVSVPDISTVKSMSEGSCGVTLRNQVRGALKKARDWELKHSRKVIHCLKLGLAISLVSLTYYVKPLYDFDGIGGTALGAILTAASIYDLQVGGTMYKGFTETTANIFAVAVAVGIHLLATRSGEKAEPIIRGASVFLLASAATLCRYIRRVRALFEDGMMTFVIIFILFLVSGYRDGNMIEVAQQRLASVAIGSSIAALVCMFICPVWAGNELHLLVTRNMQTLAKSLNGCVVEYFKKGGEIAGEEKACQDLEGYKCILNSKASEDSLACLAKWEPAHGRFGFRHPWKQYLKVGAEMRYCSYCIEALQGCISSEIQAPDHIKKQLSNVCMRLSSHSSNILNELAISTKSMRKSLAIDFLVTEMNTATEELRNTLKSLPNQPPAPATGGEEKRQPIWMNTNAPLMEVVSLITFASLLIESSGRIKRLVDATDDLASLASFKPAKQGKPKLPEPGDKFYHLGSQGQEEKKTPQQASVPCPPLLQETHMNG